MIAAKHLDPILGIDIHLILTPAGVTLPIPHPHIGIILDPMDYLPIFGATVEVHGLKRAQAGTSGLSSPHFPIGGTFIKPPGNESEIFMGSSTVLVDGDPFTYLVLPVLSCHDVGMPAPARLKGKVKTRSLTLPTTVVLAIPNTVQIGGSPTISLTALAMKVGMAALGKAFKKLKGTKLWKRMKNRFAKVRQKIFGKLKPGFLKCNILKAEPVDITTGEVVVEQQDFALPWPLPLEWRRRYASRSTRAGLCGVGWETPADARLVLDDDGVVLFYDGGAGATVFPSLPTGGPVIEAVDGGVLRDEGLWLVVQLKDGRHYRFPQLRGDRREVLVTSIFDRCGQYIEFARDGSGLSEIRSSTGARIHVDSRGGRIQRMVLHHPAEPRARSLVRYEHGPDGDLLAVYDPLGAPYRFAYREHCLVRHTDRNGLSFYYEFDEHTPAGRVVHTWGDGGLYDYTFDYGLVGERVRIRDSLGHVSTVEFDINDLPFKETDPLGGVTLFEYDEWGRTTAVVRPGGLRTEYEYDERGNLTRLVRPDGAAIVTEYDTADQPIRVTDPNGQIWRQEWDARGRLVRQVRPTGATMEYFYDARGDLAGCRNPRGAVTRLRRDPYGNVTAVIDALGHEDRFEVDGLGNITSSVDAAGRQNTYLYDAASRLIAWTSPSHATVNFAYDRQGNLIRHQDRAGHVTHLGYTGMGDLAVRQQPDGARVEYRYDTEARLVGVVNQRGQLFKLVRDPLGRVVEELDYWGQRRRHQFDTAGHLACTEDALGRIIKYSTDRLGRITRKLLPDGEAEEFEYDANGNLLATTNRQAQVSRLFDAEDRLLEERQGEFKITNTYDTNGNRIQRDTSNGNRVVYGYNLLDQAISISINDAPPICIERNALGQTVREELTTGLSAIYEYGLDGLMTHYQAVGPDGTMIDRQWSYDQRGNLVQRTDSLRGIDVFLYDPMGRVREHIDVQGKINTYLHDPSGDLLRDQVCHLTPDGAWERSAEHSGVVCKFDAAGNMIERRDGTQLLKLEWDASNRLVLSHHPDGTRTSYGYDAQGRRVFKETDRQRTWFCWDGDALISDLAPTMMGQAREFVYYPDTFVPVAAINWDRTIYHYHNDPNGQPCEMTDAAGQVIWAARGAAWRPGEESKENPLRLQGQYFDSESGLSYNRNRYYDSSMGSFISQDPLGLAPGENLYQYAPNIWRWTDPLGLSCGKDVALGLDPHYKSLPGVNYKNWAAEGITRRTVDNRFGRAFHQAVDRAEHIHFALDGIDDVADAVKRGKAGFDPGSMNPVFPRPGNMTNAELHHIATNPDLLNKTTFYRNGVPVDRPDFGL